MESARDFDGGERQVSPTVSKDKWINHARTKLAKGYSLIVSKERKSANFFMRGKGFEMCAYQTARALIQQGIVVESGTHRLGTVYTLSESAAATMPPHRHTPKPARPQADVDDDLPDLATDDLTDDVSDDDLELGEEE